MKMKIVAIAVGSQGDVKPFVELGKELISRGHSFKIGAFPRFEKYVTENGLDFSPINGDGDLMMRVLLSEDEGGTKHLKAMKMLFNKNPEMMNQSYEACKSADLVLYILLGGFVRHAADALGIPCVRCFFYPFDKTKAFSIQQPSMKRNTINCAVTYTENEFGMNMVTKALCNNFRTEHSLKKWRLTSNYLKQNGKPVLTLYPFSEVLVPRPKEWGNHIHITGYWEMPQSTFYTPDDSLKKFLECGEKPIYIGFGSIVYKDMEMVQQKVMAAIKKTGIRAILSSGWMNWEKEQDNNLYFVDYVPHEWLFKQVAGVIHHGGAGTTYQGLCSGCPTSIMSFGGDQYFWGLQVYERGLGPKPIDIHSKDCTVEKIAENIQLLISGKYNEEVKKAQKTLISENGCKNAADTLEKLYNKRLD